MQTFALNNRRILSFLVSLAPGLLLALPVSGLTISPARVEINAFDDVIRLSLTHEGAPVPASSVSSVKLFVEKHDYDHMITVGKAEGQITITPTRDLELGVYDLRIKTAVGEGLVEVISLQGIADAGLEARARRQGVTVEAIKAQLGISQPLGREQIDLGLPASYSVGQIVTMAMSPAAGRTGVWRVNGDLVPSEGGTLTYVLEHVGVYDFAYIEKEGERVATVGLGTVVVTSEAPTRVEVEAGVKLSLLAPGGYGAAAWSVDGVADGTEPTWSGVFSEAGSHKVQVRVSEPSEASGPAFRVVSYLVTVK